MAPHRRAIDDLRSEASSSIANLKDRSYFIQAGSKMASRGKRVVSATQVVSNGTNSLPRIAPNGVEVSISTDAGQNVPRVRPTIREVPLPCLLVQKARDLAIRFF